MNDYKTLMVALWQSACQDAPARPSARVVDGHFVLTINGNRGAWGDIVRAAGAPDSAEQTVDGDTLTVRWPSVGDAIFGQDGMIAAILPGYEMRAPQLHMARLVQRAIEMGEPAVVEAGTGTGKSFAYAAVCMAMNKKVVISTSNKALQMQLADKDLPFLQRIFPGKKVAVSVGKSNYACNAKCDAKSSIDLDDVVPEGAQIVKVYARQSVEYRERENGFDGKYKDLTSFTRLHPRNGGELVADADLRNWYETTDTGNTEEITFAPDYKALKAITVDDECGGQHCPFYAECFYYAARARMQAADVIVSNHALLCLNQVAEGHILPPADVTVVDEAHKLPDYMRSAWGAEVTASQVRKAIALAEGYADHDLMLDADNQLTVLERAIATQCGRTSDPQIGLGHDTELAGAATLAAALLTMADDVWAEDEAPADADEKRNARRAQRIRNMAGRLSMLAGPTQPGMVRWIEQGRNGDPAKVCTQPFDVSGYIARLAGIRIDAAPVTPPATHCARCHRELTARTVAILDGQPYGPDCIGHVDVLGDAVTVTIADWLAQEQPAAPVLTYSGAATIFTSATLAAPDMAHFMRSAGLPHALQMQAASPFDYAANALLYLPPGAAPAPNAPDWADWAIDQMRQLVIASGGGAFLLFTSCRMMQEAALQLRPVFAQRRLTVLMQGDMPKAEIARRFRDDGSAVLFATKSFFEGVSIDGQALRLVVVDKMPFEAPSPLTTAMEADMLDKARAAGMSGKTLEMHPFNALRVPRMVIELKQALGRLIRTQTDTGVMAVLDSRVRSAMYGRNVVLPSLPPAPLAGRVESVAAFFGTLPPLPVKLTAPPAEVREEKRSARAAKAAVVFAPAGAGASEEIPF